MAVRYYLSPWVDLVARGAGRFALSGAGRSTSGPKALIYADWRRDVTGARCSTVKPTARNIACVVRVEGDASLHATLATDPDLTDLGDLATARRAITDAVTARTTLVGRVQIGPDVFTVPERTR